MTIFANASRLSASASCNVVAAGSRRSRSAVTAATCMAVGKVSLEDCERLTSSLGWIGVLLPSSPPASSMARLEITSLTFMFDCVPLPVCQTTSGKWSSRSPAMI